MAYAHRHQQNTLKEHLSEQVHHYDFFQAVDLLHILHSTATPVGKTGPPSEEVLRFLPQATFGFSPSDLVKLANTQENGKQAELHTAFLSLYGRHGALPWHYTSQFKTEEKELKKSAMRAFLDLFNHRLISQFYRAGTKYRLPGIYRGGPQDPLVTILGSLAGVGTRDIWHSPALPVEELSAHGSLFQQPHSAQALKDLLEQHFSFPVHVRELVGEWLPIDCEERSVLGRGKRHNQLGLSFCVGRRTWSVQHKITLEIGPISYDRYCAIQPNTPEYQKLDQLAQLFIGPALVYTFHFELIPHTTPGFLLGSPTPLGRALWLRTPKSDHPIFHTFEAEIHTHFIEREYYDAY